MSPALVLHAAQNTSPFRIPPAGGSGLGHRRIAENMDLRQNNQKDRPIPPIVQDRHAPRIVRLESADKETDEKSAAEPEDQASPEEIQREKDRKWTGSHDPA